MYTCIFHELPSQFTVMPRTWNISEVERPESLPVSFPLSSFTAAPCHSTKSLLERLDVTGGLPCGKLFTFVHKVRLADEWSCYTGWNHTHVKNALHFSKLDVDRTIPDIIFCLSIKEDVT